MHKYSLGDVFVANSCTADFRCSPVGFVGVLSHSSALISLAASEHWMFRSSLFLLVVLDELVLVRVLPFRVIFEIVVVGLFTIDLDVASVGRALLTILVIDEIFLLVNRNQSKRIENFT